MTSEADLRSLVLQALSVVPRSRTYLNLVYLVLALPLALLYFAVLAVCAVVGTVLAIVGIGLLILLVGLAAAWGFGMLERELAISLLGLDLPPPPTLPVGTPWRRLRGHLTRAETWKSLAYLALKLPFGIFVYALGGLVLLPTLGLLTVGVRFLLPDPGAFALVRHLLELLLGFALLVGCLHGANLLASLWGRVANAILGPSEQQRQLWEARRRAEAADRKRRELIVNVSHELRTPIASILGHLDSLMMSPEQRPADLDEATYLATAAAETKRLSSLVNELLDLARADESNLALSVKPTDVVPIVCQVALALAPLASHERQVTVVTGDPGGPVLAMADPNRLMQVLTNLVRNGITHTPPGGAVKLGVDAAAADHVVISVSDTGSGIAAEDLDRIFDRFYRTDDGRSRDAGGFGLGLSIAKDLVAAMGGSLTVSSEVGVGSTFEVRLKRASG